MFAVFSVITLLLCCYNPFVYNLFLRIPQTNEAVYGRIWIILPVWLTIAFSGTEIIDKINNSLLKTSFCILFALGIIFTGSWLILDYYRDSASIYKVDSEGLEIANEILSLNNNEPVEMIIFRNNQEAAGNFVDGGTAYFAIEQYTGKIGIEPIYYNDQLWPEFCGGAEISSDEAKQDYVNNYFSDLRRIYDFSCVAMPQDDSFKTPMYYSGYQYIGSIDGNDIYISMPRWWVYSFSNVLEGGKKIYVLADNRGHFVIVGGGSKSDRRQLQRIMSFCGNHVELWILPNLSDETIEGFNCIAQTEEYMIDSVCIPAIDVETIPEGFMNEQDLMVFEDLLALSEVGKFDLLFASEGDELELYGMSFQILSDMLEVQTGDVTDNSMLFRMEAGDKSFLFCSYIGYEQGQIALSRYGNSLNSDYVQIASGSGDGLGQDFYDAVCPDIAFCDSIVDDAGLNTYDLLTSCGVTCYCLEKDDPRVVVIE